MLIQRHEEPSVASCSLILHSGELLFYLLMETFLPREWRRLNHQNTKITGTGSKNGPTLIFITWFLKLWILGFLMWLSWGFFFYFFKPWILNITERTLYSRRWFREYTDSWRTYSTATYCHLTGFVTESPKGFSTILSIQLLLNCGEHVMASEFCEYRSITRLLLLWSEFLDLKQYCLKYHGSWKHIPYVQRW